MKILPDDNRMLGLKHTCSDLAAHCRDSTANESKKTQ